MSQPQGDELAQAAGALHEATKRTDWINQQVSEGKLRLNPEAAEAAAKQCEKSAQKVTSIRAKLAYADTVKGLGNYQTSLELKHQLEQKAVDGAAGGLALLQKLRDALLDEADAYRNAAKDYHVTDEQVADDLRKGQK